MVYLTNTPRVTEGPGPPGAFRGTGVEPSEGDRLVIPNLGDDHASDLMRGLFFVDSHGNKRNITKHDEKRLQYDNIASTIAPHSDSVPKCCLAECTRHASVAEVIGFRQSYAGMSQKDKAQYLLNEIYLWRNNARVERQITETQSPHRRPSRPKVWFFAHRPVCK